MYVTEIHLYLLQIHLFRYHQTVKTKHLCYFRLIFGLLVTVNNSTCSQCSYLLQNAHRKHGLKQEGIGLHLQFVHIFVVPVQQFHSTHTPQNPLRHYLTTQNTKNHTHSIRPTSSDKTQLFTIQPHSQNHSKPTTK